jgi:hypothetical protein
MTSIKVKKWSEFQKIQNDFETQVDKLLKRLLNERVNMKQNVFEETFLGINYQNIETVAFTICFTIVIYNRTLRP